MLDDKIERSKWANSKLIEALEKIPQPNELQGVCRNHRNCFQFDAILANGYCTPCWDKGMGSRNEDYKWKPSMG